MKTQCPNCKSKFNINETSIGKQAKCPKCAKPFVIEPFVETPAVVELLENSSESVESPAKTGGAIMKKCPYCAEEIRYEAIKCKHCGEMLDKLREETPPKTSGQIHNQHVEETKPSEGFHPQEEECPPKPTAVPPVKVRTVIMDEQPGPKIGNEQENCDRELKKPFRNVIWYSLLFMFIGLAFLFFACAKYYIEMPEGFEDELAKAMAHTTLLGIVFYVLRRISCKTRKGVMTFFYISIIFCIFAVYQSLGLLVKVSNAKKVLNNIVSFYNDANAGKEISIQEKNGTEQYGELTPLMNIMIETGSAIQKDLSAMNDEIQECQFDSIFKTETLTKPQLLSEALSNYEKAIIVLDKYEKQIRLRFDECLIKIRNSSVPEDLKSRVLSKAKKANDQGLKNILELFEIRRKFAAEAKNLLIYVKSSPNSCTYQNNKMVFGSEEDANFCGTSIRKLMSLSQEEDDWRKKTEQEVSTKLRQVNELVK